MTSTSPLLSSSSSSSSSLPSSSPNNSNILNSSDGEISIIDDNNVADLMTAIYTSLEFLFGGITGDILSKVHEYCKAHTQNPNNTDPNWDKQFVNGLDPNTLFQLILAAKSLEIQSLFDLTCQSMADIMKGKSTEEIRRIFNIKNHDFRSRSLSRSSSSSSSSSYPCCMIFCLPFSTLFERFKTKESSLNSCSSKKMVRVCSSEGKIFKVEEKVALQSEMVKILLEECHNNRVIILEVNTLILSKVLDYCKKHVINDHEEVFNWDAEFVMVDQKTLFDVIDAANYLQIKSLLNFTCHFLAYMILEQ